MVKQIPRDSLATRPPGDVSLTKLHICASIEGQDIMIVFNNVSLTCL